MPACDLVLGLPETTLDPVDAICKCEDDRSFFVDAAGVALDCVDTLRAELLASEDDGAAWVLAFGEDRCDVCENIAPCLSRAPVCRPLGEACAPKEHPTCCGFDADDPTKVSCLTSEANPSVGTCVEREQGCLSTGSYCSENSDCCGVAQGGACLEVVSPNGTSPPVCFSGCDPESPQGCAGCCARIEFVDRPDQGICLDVIATGVDVCEALSCEQPGGCPEDTACFPEPYGLGFLYTCDVPPE